MAKEDKTHTFKVVNKAITAAAVSNKGPFNHQPKNSNNFMTVLSNSLQEHSHAFQV